MCQSLENLETEIQRLREENSELREKLRQLMNRSSKNSSIPPSSDPKANKDEPINRGGAKHGHAAQIRKLLSLDRVDSIKKYELDKCLHCKKKKLVEIKSPAPFQYIELENGRCFVTQYEAKRYRCCSCKKQFSAPLPTGIGPSNYGPNFQAAIGMMTGHFHLSKRDAVEFCAQLFAIAISVGTICKIERRITNSLSKAYDEVREKAQNNEGSIYVDETGWRDQRKNCYMWAAVSPLFAFYRIHGSRSRQARDELIGKNFSGKIVTDRYSAYSNLWAIHQYCLAHLKRNLIKFAEGKGNPSWIASAVIRELDHIFHLWRLYQGNELSRKKLCQRSAYRRQQIRNLLLLGEAEAVGKFHRFCRKLLEQFDRLWTFLRVPGMEPTNNHAERSLRKIVLWRKKSLGTQSEAGKRFVAIISTVCQTLKKQKKKILSFLANSMKGLEPSII